jgi:hypothetical protein
MELQWERLQAEAEAIVPFRSERDPNSSLSRLRKEVAPAGGASVEDRLLAWHEGVVARKTRKEAAVQVRAATTRTSHCT